jgi:hypothetical protein
MERRCWYDYPLRRQALGISALLADRIECNGCDARDQPKEGLEDGGFEIEIIRWEKPKSNVFAFPIEDAQDLDFFDQPKPSAEEIPEGTVRPESVTGSYAVNHKTKVDHPVGDTIYAPGKARHIYRPNEDRIGRSKLGQCSVWQGLVATSAPQEPVARNSGSQLSGIPPRGRLQG